MTDPLGQSQVLPYLCGLSRKGHTISLISAEKPEAYAQRHEHISAITKNFDINWHPVPYTSKPPVLSTLKDLRAMRRLALKLHKQTPFDALHCRSYIAALIGLHFKRKKGVPFIFDMRGFWADERVEGGIWNIGNPLLKMVYNYFKKKEKTFLREAAHTVSLTDKGRDILHTWLHADEKPPITVIPCCADMELFDRTQIDDTQKALYRSKLNLPADVRIISYLGSLGTWYMPDEMMAFFRVLLTQQPTFVFLFITPDKPQEVLALADRHKVPREKIFVYKAHREEVPVCLSLSEVSLFFIKPVFSKQASSPTKQAEVLSMGIPIICNDGIGDTGPIISQYKAGIVTDAFNDKAYNEAANLVDSLRDIPPAHMRSVAAAMFSLETGVDRYNEIYSSVNKKVL